MIPCSCTHKHIHTHNENNNHTNIAKQKKITQHLGVGQKEASGTITGARSVTCTHKKDRHQARTQCSQTGIHTQESGSPPTASGMTFACFSAFGVRTRPSAARALNAHAQSIQTHSTHRYASTQVWPEAKPKAAHTPQSIQTHSTHRYAFTQVWPEAKPQAAHTHTHHSTPTCPPVHTPLDALT